jgi:hypothetical protein
MKSARARPRILAVAAACALGAACSSPSEPHGSPVLLQIYWVAGGVPSLAWAFDKDPGMSSPLPPFASEVDFVFDRRLDGAKIEDLVTMNGVRVGVPKSSAPLHVTWPDMGTVMSDPPFHMAVDYNSVPRYGGVTSYVYARPDVPGFPAGDTLTFSLVPTLLTSAYDEPAVVPKPDVTVKTSAFAPAIVITASPVIPSYQVPLNFTNRLPVAPATSPHVHVTAHGVDVPYKLLSDASLASRWYLAAADCLGGWPTGTAFEVTIDAAFADAFGDELGQPTKTTFSTSAGAAPPAQCPLPEAGTPDAETPHAGTPDAGTLDAPAEVGAGDGDASALDAAADGGVEAATDAAADASADSD